MKLVINADDFGMTHEANTGISLAFKQSLCSQTSIVTNLNYFDEAVDIAQKESLMDKTGLHINLFEGTPLTGGIKTLKKYCYYDMFSYQLRGFQKYLPLYKDILAEELEAQIIKYLQAGFTLMNIDSHHCSFYDIPILYALRPLLKKYDFKSIRYIGNSYFNGNIWHEWYGKYWLKKMSELRLKHANYISSVSTYIKNKQNQVPELLNADKIEIYVHPVSIGNRLYDNYTGGKSLLESVLRTEINRSTLVTVNEFD